LYIEPGDPITAVAAAWAKRLYAPTWKLSKVRAGSRGDISPNKGSLAAGAAAATGMVMGMGVAAGIALGGLIKPAGSVEGIRTGTGGRATAPPGESSASVALTRSSARSVRP